MEQQDPNNEMVASALDSNRREFLLATGGSLGVSAFLPGEADAHDYSDGGQQGDGDGDITDPRGASDGLEPKAVTVNGPGEHGINDVETRYYAEGNPNDPALVLVHGSGLSGLASANLMTPNVAGLSEDFFVVAPDRLAAGATQNPHPPKAENFTFRSEVEHMKAFLDEVLDSEQQRHLVGHSRGGGIVGVVATDEPDRVDTLTLLSSGTMAPEWYDSGFRRRQVQGDPQRFDIDLSPEESWRYGIEKLSYTTEHVTDDFVSSSVFLDSRQKVQETRENVDGERYDESVHEAVTGARDVIRRGELETPTLLHWGGNDPVTAPIPSGEALHAMVAAGNPITRFRTVNHAGHLAYREYPEEVNYHLTSFVDFWT